MKLFLKLIFLFIFLSHFNSIAEITCLDKKVFLSVEMTTPSQTVHYASNLKELVDALGNDRKIVITNDIYIKDGLKKVVTDTSKFFMRQYRGDGLGGVPKYVNEFYDICAAYSSGREIKERLINNDFEEFIKGEVILVIKKAQNLTITTNNTSSIIMRQSEDAVINFEHLTDFTLLNLSIYHEVETDGGCGEFAPVISFYDSNKIVVDHCKLNGSGTEGINTDKVTDLLIKNTEVFNCNKRGFSFENSTGITISNSKVYENFLNVINGNYGDACIFHLRESEVSVENTSIISNSSHTEGRYSILKDNSTITFKECYVADNENFVPSSDLFATSVDKPLTPINNDDSVYKQFESYYVSAKSGLNYRASPKGTLLGKYPVNTKVTVIEHTKIVEEITDEGKVIKGEWVGIQNKQDTVYVFSAFLSPEPVELHLKIYNLSPYENQISNPPNGEVRTAFVNISETYFENKKYDYLIHKENLIDTITLNPSLRKRFLKTVSITEEETIFVYEMETDVVHTYKVKDLPIIACPNIYGYDEQYGESDYEFGFDLGKLDISYDNFVYIGKKNPFQTGKIKSILWKEIDTKEFPKKFNINIVDEDIRSWFNGYTIERSFKFTHNNLTYYIQNLEKDEEVSYRYALVFKGEKLIYEDVYMSSEGTYLIPLNIENEKSQYEAYQFTGEIFKGKPPIIFGFESHSFGCPSIYFADNTEPSIGILCDNRH